MNVNSFKKYLNNCFLLTIPILVWNLIFTNQLPQAFQPEVMWNDIPVYITYGENILRTIVFMLTMLMPLRITTREQKIGLILYVAGTLIYFLSWLPLMYYPESNWSNHVIGFMAPAYTPVFWLIGIGIVGNAFYFRLPFKRWYFISVSILFLIFHNLHTFLIFNRIHI